MNYLNQIVERKKSIALITGVSMIAAFEFSRIYVPDCVKNKNKYRLNYLLNQSVIKIAKLGHLLRIGSEPVLIRKFIKLFKRIINVNINPNDYQSVKVSEAIANQIRIKIYYPKSNIDELYPLMFYYHGGGYALNSIDNYHHILLPIASDLQIVIIAIEYPLAPENKYPKPIEESFKTTQYILNNLEKYDLNVDINRVVFAGDSAGANISIILSNQFRSINENLPKLQALINPPTQYFNMLLPSMIKYSNIETYLPRTKMILWHMGISSVEEYQENYLLKNYHTLLADEHLRTKFNSYLDINLIPEVYRKGYSYYDSYDKCKDLVYPNVVVKENKKLNENFEALAKQLFNLNISPGLADDEVLKKQPKTFMIISELDTRKDEGLIYASRLSNNGVQVDIAFFETGFHTSFVFQEQIGRAMRNDLVNYLKNNL